MIKSWLTRKFRNGAEFGSTFFAIFALAAVARFLFDGHSVTGDATMLLPQLGIALIGAGFAGLSFRNLKNSEGEPR